MKKIIDFFKSIYTKWKTKRELKKQDPFIYK